MLEIDNKEFEFNKKDGILTIKEYFSEYKQGYFKISLNRLELLELTSYMIGKLS